MRPPASAPQRPRGAPPLAWLLAAAPAIGCACALQPVAIEPAAAEPTDIYIGRTSMLEVRFHNDKTIGPVDVFPEPPMTVQRPSSPASCRVNDGGIWVRRHVFASTDGSMLVTHEYSGSNDELAFYDTRTCGKRASVDLSITTWRMEGDTLRMTRQAPDKAAMQVTLDAHCLPRPSARTRLHR